MSGTIYGPIPSTRPIAAVEALCIEHLPAGTHEGRLWTGAHIDNRLPAEETSPTIGLKNTRGRDMTF